MDIWHGSICRKASDLEVKDVHFSHQDATFLSSVLPSGTELEILSIVETSRIPLHLAAGPLLDVWTDNEDTEAFFSGLFLNSQPDPDDLPLWWEAIELQSTTGLLLRAPTYDSVAVTGECPRITEILIYARGSHTSAPPCLPITPPPSSSPLASPRPGREYSHHPKNICIYAVPLSSDLSHIDSPPLGINHGINLVSSVQDVIPLAPPRPTAGGPSAQHTFKRSHTDSLFESATARKVQAKRRGGERISQAVSSQYDPQLPALPPFPQPKAARTRANQSSPPNDDIPSRVESKHGPTTRDHRSSFSRVASLSDLDHVFHAPTVVEVSPFEAQNKEALSKMVMAGLRMFGLQQKRPAHDKKASITSAHPSCGADEPVDEYKLVYHQVFKGACFALRRQLHDRMLRQQDMRETVDKLLTLFCTDPLGPGLCAADGVMEDVQPTPGFGAVREVEDKSPFCVKATSTQRPVSIQRVRRG